MLRLAGDVGIDVALQLEASSNPGLDERLERAKDRRPPDGRFLPPELLVQLVGGQLPADAGKPLGDEEPLTRDPFAGRRQTWPSCKRRAIHAATLSQARLRIMGPGMDGHRGLVLRDLSAGYGDGLVVHDVDLEIGPGTLVGVIGPNGSGKSTLLKAILGLTPLTRGRVELDARPVSAQRHRVAYVPQRETVDWSFPVTAEQVVLMGRYPQLGWLRMPGPRERAAARDGLERVGIADQADRQIGALSGGQQQRVFLARALVQDAAVLLLDEPMTGVDQATERVIVDLLRELRDGGATILHATHDLESASELSDQLCFINGRVIAFGPPAETFTPAVLHATFGGELLIVDAGDHRHVHAGGHHGPSDTAHPR